MRKLKTNNIKFDEIELKLIKDVANNRTTELVNMNFNFHFIKYDLIINFFKFTGFWGFGEIGRASCRER